VFWNIDRLAATGHSVTDATGMGLFDSGLRQPGDSFAYTFTAAGTYSVLDRATGHASAVSVGMGSTAASGTTSTAFGLHWASATPPAGYTYDLQVKRPGTTDYTDLRVGTSTRSTRFTPDSGVGTYSFRTRIRNTGNGASSGWSSAKTITVS
jgi:hypothetical protein